MLVAAISHVFLLGFTAFWDHLEFIGGIQEEDRSERY